MRSGALTSRLATIPPLPPALRRFKGVFGLVGILVIAIWISPRAFDGSNIFLEAGNITDILRQMSVIGIIALSMTYVILTAGIDLSVGSTLALSTAVVATFVTHPILGGHWLGGVAAVALGIGASAVVGLLNGLVISTFRIQPFIVTLASMIGIRGFAKWLTNNANIDIGFGSDLAASFAAVAGRKMVVIGTFILLAVVFWIVLERTVFGRYVRAIGDNEKASKYTGLPVRRVKVWVYMLCGTL